MFLNTWASLCVSKSDQRAHLWNAQIIIDSAGWHAYSVLVQPLSSQSTLPSEKGAARLAGVGILIGTPILYARTRTGEAALQHKDRV